MQRRLAAILAADTVGFSRLMGEDDEGTLLRLKSLREKLIAPAIRKENGRIFKLTGDGILAEFASALGAVRCAVEIQAAMRKAEAEKPECKRLSLRIGLNLGDIIVDGDDVFGDGVNIAARLEGLANPGGICLSSKIHSEVAGKVDLTFVDLGLKELKNIPTPIRVFACSSEPESLPSPSSDIDKAASTQKPTIAVLAFTNMSGDREQDYFADGITEDIITELSRFKNLHVIARNSSFAYRGQAIDAIEAGRRLNADYLVEGSMRKAGGRIRVTAQLIDTTNANHLWADRYDRDLADIFEVQDELVHEIVAAIPGQLDVAAVQRAGRQPPANLSAYEYLLRGEWLLAQNFGDREALFLFEKAIERDPQCARAYTRLASFHAYSIFAHGAAVEDSARTALSMAEKALRLDPIDPAVQANAALAYILVGEHALAEQHLERAIKLNPNDYNVMHMAAVTLHYLGRPEEAAEWSEKLSRHDPFPGDAQREHKFDLAYMTGRYKDAIEIFQGWRHPPLHMYVEYAAACAQCGHIEDTKSAMEQFDRLRPRTFDPQAVACANARMCVHSADREHWLEGYRKAGLPV